MEKKTVNKKKPVKKATSVKETIVNNEVTVKNQVNYTLVLNRIFYALVVIGVLLALNLCVNLIANTKSSNNEKTNQNETNNNGETNLEEYDVSDFETLTTSELDSKLKDGGTQVVYIGRSTCGYCVKFLPILKEAQKDLDYKTIYVNLEEVSESDAKTLTGYDSYVEENLGYTPMVLVFRDGEFVKGTVGYTDLDTFKSFLKEAGIE